MPQATSTSTTSRRSLLAAMPAAALASPLAAVPALAAFSPSPSPDEALSPWPSPDEALLDLCRRWLVAWDAVTDPSDDADDDGVSDGMAVVNDLEKVITEMPSLTLAGLAAKAEVFKLSSADHDINPGRGLLASILEDIAALAGEAAHV
jgi:hypothetical protein